jgi:hypothetical protein
VGFYRFDLAKDVAKQLRPPLLGFDGLVGVAPVGKKPVGIGKRNDEEERAWERG